MYFDSIENAYMQWMQPIASAFQYASLLDYMR